MIKEEVINNLKKVASQIKDREYITLSDLRLIPGLEYYVYFHFGKLGNALQAAGLPSSKLAASMQISNDDLLAYLRDLKAELGHNPTVMDIGRDKKIYKKYSKNKIIWSIYKSRFNGLRAAVEQIDGDNGNRRREVLKSDNTHIPHNTNRFYGEGAELHVTAELLYHGFQAANIPVDEGLDILAVKENKTFYFQVKHKDLNSNAPIKLTKSSFERSGGGSVYYIFVLLSDEKREFLVIPFHIVNDWIREGLAEGQGKEYLIPISRVDEGYKFKNIKLDRFLGKWEDIR